MTRHDRLRIGQSADPDDAFMAWGLQRELQRHGLECELRFADIETLNREAIAGRLDLTALSVGAYPVLASRYRMLRSGASFGNGYGPLVVDGSSGPDTRNAIRRFELDNGLDISGTANQAVLDRLVTIGALEAG